MSSSLTCVRNCTDQNHQQAPIVVLTVLTALRHRSAMRTALQGRDEITVQPILKWACKYIQDPRYLKVCVEVGLFMIDLYSEQMGQSPEVDALFKRLHGEVRRGVERAQQACQTDGMLGMLMAGGD